MMLTMGILIWGHTSSFGNPKVTQNLSAPIPKVQHNVSSNPTDQPIRDRIRQRHQNERHERRYSLPHVLPINLHHRSHHQHPHQNQRRPHRPRGNRRQQRREEERQEEIRRHRQRRNPRPPTLPDPRRRLDERRDGGGPEQGPHHDGSGVGHEREVLSLETPLVVGEARESRHRVQRSGGVENVDVQERHHGLPEIPFAYALEAKSPRRALYEVNIHHLLEVLVGGVTRVGVGKSRDFGVAEPRHDCDENDAVYHGAFDVLHETVGDDDETHQAKPERRAFHSVAQAEDIARDCSAG